MRQSNRADGAGDDGRFARGGAHARVAGVFQACALLTLTPFAHAQDEPDTQLRLEEIVVTAQRRETSLQDTPLAVTAVTAETLRLDNVRFLEDFTKSVPGLQMPGRTIYNQFPATIRGISSIDTGPAFDMPVAMYVDGVYIGRQFGVRGAMLGVERVEVLRGPQGTLFGRNASAGAIQIIHRAPSDTPGLTLEGSAGRYSTYDVRSLIEGPLSESLKGSLSLGYQESDGPNRNQTTGNDIGGNDSASVVGALYYTPTEDLTVKLRGDYEDASSTYGGRQLARTFRGPLVSNLDPDTLLAEQGYPIGHVRNNFDGIVDKESGGASVEINYDVGDIQLVSLSAWRYYDLSGRVDTDGTDTPSANNVSTAGHDQYSQEFRASSRGDQRLQWDAGLYYFHETPHQLALISSVVPPANLVIPAQNDLDSYAAFVNGTYRITDPLELTAGVRYTTETKKFQQGALRLEDTFEATTPRVGINYHVSDDILAYISASRGFKSGGFNTLPPESFAPEEVWAYEAGMKGDFAADRLRLNLAVFKQDYEGLQVTVSTGPATTKTSNADTDIEGVELEATVLPLRSLELSGSFSYLDATYERYIFSTTPLVDFSGRRIPRSSRVKGNLAARYSRDLGNLGVGAVRVNYSHEGDMFMNDANDVRLLRPSIDLIDARVSLATADERFEVALYGQNLTDERYIGVVQFLFGFPVGFPNENRRTYGVHFTYRR